MDPTAHIAVARKPLNALGIDSSNPPKRWNPREFPRQEFCTKTVGGGVSPMYDDGEENKPVGLWG
jgi:hypothetical protein